MALIDCSECGGKLSSNAASCPHCGNPNKVNAHEMMEGAVLGDSSTLAFGNAQKPAGTSIWFKVAIGFGLTAAVLAVIIIVGLVSYKNLEPQARTEAQREECRQVILAASRNPPKGYSENKALQDDLKEKCQGVSMQ